MRMGPAWSIHSGLLMVLAIAWGFQDVPSPDLGVQKQKELAGRRLTLVENERRRLNELADQAQRRGDASTAQTIRQKIEPVLDRGRSAERFVPLPELVSAAALKAANPPGELRTWLTTQSQALLELAKDAVKAGEYTLALNCLRDIVRIDPNHAEARRILGYAPSNGGWATRFALKMLNASKLDHPTYGWVDASWLPRLKAEELPAPRLAGQPIRWVPAAEADRLHSPWNRAWEITTEHFVLRTNVPFAEAIGLSRRLEGFHELFEFVMADVLAEELPFARRLRDPNLGEIVEKTHRIFFFKDKADYVEYLAPIRGPLVERSLGVYLTAKDLRKRGMPPTSFFYRDDQAEIPTEATLFHELSHQLLYETAGRAAGFEANAGNFWVAEGVGTYFETTRPRVDGAFEHGGMVGPRLALAYQRLIEESRLVPLDQFVAWDQARFHGDDVFLNYAQAMALTVFLLQAGDADYREPFLDYVRDAFRARLKRGTGRSLFDRLGLSPRELENRLLDYLKVHRPNPEG